MTVSQIILIGPEDIGKGRSFFYRDRIINEMRKTEKLDVVGVSNSISLACSAVNMATLIAGIYVKELSLDYIPLQVLQKASGIFFSLGREPGIDFESKKAELEQGMKLDFHRDGALVVVSKKLSPEEMIPLCLSKLSKTEKLKIMGSGFWISRAASLALEIARGGISKGPVSIELAIVSTREFQVEEGKKTSTVLEIFLGKGKSTKYTKQHTELLSQLKKLRY